MKFCNLLFSLLASGHMSNTERDMRLAIDLEASSMDRGEIREIETDEASVKGLLILINENPRLRAVSVGGRIVLEKR